MHLSGRFDLFLLLVIMKMIRAINLCFGGTHHSPFVESCGSDPERFLLQCDASTCVIGDRMYVSTYSWKKLVKRIKESGLYCMHLLSKILNKSLTSFFHKMAVYSGLVVIQVYIFIRFI